MNYDKIILELMSRVQELEEQMMDVKSEINSIKAIDNKIIEEPDEESESDSEEFTRSQARKKAMEIIEQRFPDHLVMKANRTEGSGIKILKSDISEKRPVIIKFFHSKTYEHRSKTFEHAWHTVNLEEIIGTLYDFCLFSIADSNGDWHFLIFEPAELGIFRDENRSVDSDQLHLYFVVKDGVAKEVRENEVDVTDHLNNWDAFK